MRIYPFQALVPDPALADRIAAVPYDVVDTAEAAALADGNPHSFLHVSRSEIDLPPDTDPYSPAAYAKARATLDEFRNRGVLHREAAPCLYVYRLVMQGRAQTGIVACCAVDEYRSGVIKTHEKTRRDKEDDRTRHVDILNANTEPIFITYRDEQPLLDLTAAIQRQPPIYDFTAPDGIGHTLWRVANTGPFVQAFARVPCAYIADGHHRAAAAARVAEERRRDRAPAGGNEEYARVMAVLFPAGQLRILPYNRIVRDLNGLTPESFLDKLRAAFRVTEGRGAAPTAPGRIGLFLTGRWYELEWTGAVPGDAVSALDVSLLQDHVLAPILGIRDPRTDKRIEFVGGIRGTRELERRVQQGSAAAAFSMYPTLVSQMMDIADAGQIMPPKSTWFEPKLRSGLFVHTFD